MSAELIERAEIIINGLRRAGAAHGATASRRTRTHLVGYHAALSEARYRDAATVQGLIAALASKDEEIARLTAALVKLRDCDWTIGRGDRMDPVRDIARQALLGDADVSR